MTLLVLLPALFAAYFAHTRSPQLAFVGVYIPVLLWFPSHFQWKPPLIPDPSFAEASALAVLALLIVKGIQHYRFTVTDGLVFTFVLFVSLSEYAALGYKEAQNLMASMFLSVLVPYLLAKLLIEPYQLRTTLAKIIVIVLCIIAVLMIYELFFRQGHGLWQKALGPFFGQGWTRDTEHRWGLTRAEGPFLHPIMAGMIMVIGFRLHRWLTWQHAWPAKPIKNWPRLPLPSFMAALLLLGMVSTLSRGPWLSAAVSILIIFILVHVVKLARQPLKRYILLLAILILAVLLGLAADEAIKRFASISTEEAAESSQELQTVAYRFELLTTYGEVILERWLLGWGRLGWPQDKFQWSVDNYYLLLALNHGIISVTCFTSLFLYLMAKLLNRALHQPTSKTPETEFSMTLLALLVAHLIFIATVALFQTNLTLLFILFGWCDAYLQTSSQPVPTSSTPYSQPDFTSNRFHFQRTL